MMAQPKKKTDEQKNIERKLKAWLEQPWVQVILAINLVITLFLPDLWTIGDPHNDADNAMNVILTIGFVLFVAEIIITCKATPKAYSPFGKGSFFFWMDVVGTLSILIDITWINRGLSLGANAQDATTLRAARVAKLGARSSRLAKFAKLVKNYLSNDKEVENDSDSARVISFKLGQLLASRVAALVIFLIVVSPVMQITVVDFSHQSFSMATNSLLTSGAAANMTATQWADYVAAYEEFYEVREGGTETINLPKELTIWGLREEQCPTDSTSSKVKWRGAGGATFTYNDGSTSKPDKPSCAWIFNSWDENDYIRDSSQVNLAYKSSINILADATEGLRDDAGYNVALVSLVIVLLVGFSASFNASVDEIVVKPLSRIMTKLRTTASSVLDSVKSLADDDEEDDEEGLNEADVLELMVDKLSRIVKNVMQTNVSDVLAQNRDIIDESTEQFLNQYADTGKKDADIKKTATLSAGAIGVSTADLPVSPDLICSFDFDTLALTHDELVPCAMYMFEHMHLLKEFQINPSLFRTWVGKIRIRYKLDPAYHNWWHGVDVLHTTFRLLDCAKAEAYMSKLEIFSTMVAATAHDVGHVGVNNAFLVKSKDVLALKYNDKSPLENMHCATLYEVVGEVDANIFATLTDEQWHDCRKQIVECILNTDMANHFGNVGKLQNFYEVSGEEIATFVSAITSGASDVDVPSCFTDPTEGPKNRLLLQETLLHSADLSNPIKPLAIYQKWVTRVTDEFFAQGEKEKSVGFPVSAMMDRATTNIPNMQVGFITFIIAPIYTALFKFFPEGMVVVAGNLVNNHHFYLDEARKGKMTDGSLTPEDEEKYASQKAKFKEGLSFVPWDLLNKEGSRHLYTVATTAK
jgi:cAMP-specific phosphodiesterase 4